MFNPAESIYQAVDKRIKQGKIIAEKDTKMPKGKGILTRVNKQKNVLSDQYLEPIDYIVDAVITLRKEKEALMENINGNS